ncbi:hypothetical protein N4G69_39625 [Streptomyces mirabilis]|uniref:hypothetical protein n=1 Tax=Streptomyces mirabilis TaxID=68239 RepID=UPI0021C102DD|nr:hypothetical protein [Streptomyces mirabilis]MCT9111631.1 hypothetical protein [Streptomyces mirabilis]
MCAPWRVTRIPSRVLTAVCTVPSAATARTAGRTAGHTAGRTAGRTAGSAGFPSASNAASVRAFFCHAGLMSPCSERVRTTPAWEPSR